MVRRRPWWPRRWHSGPGGHGARRLRSGAARRPERAGGPGARGGAALGRVSAARDGSGNVRAGRRRHGRVPAAPAQEEKGNGVGKLESGAGSSPRDQFGRRRPERGRSTEGRSSGAARQWRPVTQALWRSIRPRVGSNELGNGWRRQRAKPGRLWREGSRRGGEDGRRGRRRWPELELGSTHARGRRKKGENRHGSGREDKDGHASAAGVVRRRPTRGDANVDGRR